MRDVIVIGGGCYGTFYAGQLAKAQQKGKAGYRRVIVVGPESDVPRPGGAGRGTRSQLRDPGMACLLRRASRAGGAHGARGAARLHRAVPAHAASHVRVGACARAGAMARSGDRGGARAGRTGHCVRSRRAGPHAVRVVRRLDLRHALRRDVFGVGTFAVDAVLAGDQIVKAARESGEPAAVLVGTVSSCHGALNLLRIGRQEAVGGGGRR